MAFLPTSYADPREAFFAPLRAIGLQPHQLTGIDWNVQDESGWDPGINEAAPRSGRGGFGLYQLTGPRRKAYEAWAKKGGYALSNPYAQGLFAAHELQTTERKAYEKLLRAGNEEEAASIFASEFLRPAAEHLNARIAKYTGGEMPKGGATMSSRGDGGTFGLMSADAEDLLFPVEDYKRTTGDRIRGGLVGAGELLTALGAGHGTNFAATDAFIQGQRDRGMMRNTLDARNKAVSGMPSPTDSTNATLSWLQQTGHQDLVDLVTAGGMSAADAAKEATLRDRSGAEGEVDTSTAIAQLTAMGREDLAQAVTGGMKPDDALKLAVQAAPVPGQELTTDQLGYAERSGREMRQGLAGVQALNTAVKNIETAADPANESRFTDSIILQQFAKALDPLSVVREGEVSYVQSAASGLLGAIKEAQSLIDPDTGRLPPGVREKLLAMARTMRENAMATAQQDYDFRRPQFEAMKISPDKWLPNPATMFAAHGGTTAAPAVPGTTPLPEDF